jgi:hypothetical protein
MCGQVKKVGIVNGENKRGSTSKKNAKKNIGATLFTKDGTKSGFDKLFKMPLI